MNIADLLGWIGNIFFIVGVLLITRKNVKGFYFSFIGNTLYLAQGLILGITSVICLSLGLMFVNIYGIWNWGNIK